MSGQTTTADRCPPADDRIVLYVDRSVPVPDSAVQRALATGCPEWPSAPADALYLQLDADGLALVRSAGRGKVQVRGDFLGGRQGWRLRQARHRREALARACGLGRLARPEIIDATAGLGRDSALLAVLGARVTAIERHPLVAALLRDALARAVGDRALGEHLGRITVVEADAVDWLRTRPEACADVVYLDPMFADAGTAAVTKEMQLLREFLGPSPAPDALLRAARERARLRVVVKRHRHAPALADQVPSFSLTGRSTRFDVYLNHADVTAPDTETP
jgi:16S rRNA (guanine1516-N2)-methyltransferase